MPFRTKFIKLFPWVGGVNTSLDASVIDPGELVQADHLVFTGIRPSRNMRDGINYNWDSSSASGEQFIGLYDYFYGSSSAAKTNLLISLSSSGNLYSYSKTTGTRTLASVNSTATSWANTNGVVSFEVIGNTLVYAGDGSGNVPRQWQGIGSTATDLDGSPPQMSIMRKWQGRLWTDDKLTKDRLNYSPPYDVHTWGGVGDSGALDVGVGDSDPVSLTAIFPTLNPLEQNQPELFVAKLTKLYRVTGYTPETYQCVCVSDGIGCVSHNAAVAVDQSDIIFVSEKGVHSLIGTIKYGDIPDKYLSVKIQKTINSAWTRSSLKKIWAAYLPPINSVAFAVPDTNYSGTGNTAIWLYNLTLGSWYTWPNIDCQSLIAAYDTDKKRFYIGTSAGRVAKTFNGTNYDISSAGSKVDITMTIKTGVIYIGNEPMIVNGIKRFTMIYGPKGTHTVTVMVNVDNYSPQSLVFSQVVGNSILGVNFVLGSSTLGYNLVTGPYSQTIDGYGRAFQLTFIQSGQQANVDIQGFAVEFEPLGPAQETITSG